MQFFDTIAENARTWETNTSLVTAKVHGTPTGGGIHQVRENDDLQAKIANLTRKLEAIELKKVNEVTVVPKVPSVPMGSGVVESCIIYDDPTHSTINYPNLSQVKGAIKIEQENDLNYQRKCHAPDPGPTRLADPNRSPGRDAIYTIYILILYWDSH